MNSPDYLGLLQQLLPEAVLVFTALAGLFLDLRSVCRQSLAARMQRGALIAAVGLVIALGVLGLNLGEGDGPAGTFVLTPASQFLKAVLILLALATALLGAAGRFTRHVGEFFALLLLATTGLLLLVSTENLLMLFVSLELVSLSLYVMTALRADSPQSSEAALKYFLFGGVAAAFLLFGFSLLYGLTGSIQLGPIAVKLAGLPPDPLLWVALVMVAVGLGFKVAAVPFHLWAPDVYAGAPTAVAAFVASGSKVAGFLLVLRVLQHGFGIATAGSAAWHGFVTGWMPLVAGLAVLSMVIGNLTAIAQGDFRRLLAYSAVAQAGYALVGVLGAPAEAQPAVLYFATTYAVAVLGAFGVVSVLESEANGDTAAGFVGLWRRSPFLTLCLTVFVLSLAGIPPLAGFFGKLFVFTAAAKSGGPGLLWLVALALAMSAVSLYYYLQALKQAFVATDTAPSGPIRTPPLTAVVLVALAAATVWLGCFPELLLGQFR